VVEFSTGSGTTVLVVIMAAVVTRLNTEPGEDREDGGDFTEDCGGIRIVTKLGPEIMTCYYK
jgi:hypothetical protein